MIRKVKGLKYKGAKVEIQRVKGRKAPKIVQLSAEEEQLKQRQQEQEDEMFNELGATPKQKIMRPVF